MKDQGKKYKCRFCKEVFGMISDVQDHVSSQHFEDTVITEVENL